MSKVSFVGASEEERATLLGEEFRHIEVLDFEVAEVIVTRILIAGTVVTLIGDPREALRTYLGGTEEQTAQ